VKKDGAIMVKGKEYKVGRYPGQEVTICLISESANVNSTRTRWKYGSANTLGLSFFRVFPSHLFAFSEAWKYPGGVSHSFLDSW
jgi:hypothetical protein